MCQHLLSFFFAFLNRNKKLDSSLCFLFQAAFEHVRDNIDELDGKFAVDETDLIFLKGLMDSPVLQSLVKVIYFLTS